MRGALQYTTIRYFGTLLPKRIKFYRRAIRVLISSSLHVDALFKFIRMPSRSVDRRANRTAVRV